MSKETEGPTITWLMKKNLSISILKWSKKKTRLLPTKGRKLIKRKLIWKPRLKIREKISLKRSLSWSKMKVRKKLRKCLSETTSWSLSYRPSMKAFLRYPTSFPTTQLTCWPSTCTKSLTTCETLKKKLKWYWLKVFYLIKSILCFMFVQLYTLKYIKMP